MVGIACYGVYFPIRRMKREQLAEVWGTAGVAGERAVANYDEDAVTMATEAAISCMRGVQKKPIDRLLLATTSAPYYEKQSASIVASALGLSSEVFTVDYTGSLRGATIALTAATDAVESGHARNVLLIASDKRAVLPKGKREQLWGDGAAAVLVGESDLIAVLEGSYSLSENFLGEWRGEGDMFVKSWEERFVIDEGYMRPMKEVILGIMEKYRFEPRDFRRVILSAPDTRRRNRLAKTLGFDLAHVQDACLDTIGNTGTAQPLVGLISALEEASPGDRLLLATYGDGADAFIFRVTEKIKDIQQRHELKKCLRRRMSVNRYSEYLKMRNFVATEEPKRPEPIPLSVTCLWREDKKNLALVGVKCRKCGTVQYPPQRVCVACKAKDNFEDYSFSDKKGTVFTFSADYLTPAPVSPTVFAVIDFEGGGRIWCEVTDIDPNEIKIGMPVEMAFRKLATVNGISNYFWKARPYRK